MSLDFSTHSFGCAVLHEHAATTYFDFNRTGSALTVILANRACFATRHGDLAGRGNALLTQTIKKLALVSIADFIVDRAYLHACRLELGQKCVSGNLQFAGKFSNSVVCHVSNFSCRRLRERP